MPMHPLFRLLPAGCLLAIALGGAVLHAADPGLVLTNEQNTLRFTLLLDETGPGYRLDHLDAGVATPVLERSPLGITRTDLDLAKGLKVLSATAPAVVKDDYTLATGKRREIHSEGLERTFTLANALGSRLELTVRAYPDGVAFRYGLPGRSSMLVQIADEATGFKFPAGGRVWVQPYSKTDIWAPGYEADYVNGVPVGTPAPAGEGWALPLLAHTGKLWVLVTEGGLESSYFGVHLQPRADDGLYRVRLPEAAETFGVAPQAASVTLPWLSPWRVVVVSDRAGGIAESTLVTDVTRPSELGDTSWVVPGVASWSWWSDMSSPYDYAKLVDFVDVAAELGWKYSLIDLGWPYMKGGDLARLAAHAKEKNVGLILWYNSGGKHNLAPNDPTPPDPLHDLIADPFLRDAEFARIAALGVKGVKIDFMQSDKQFVIAQYHDILRDAARHRLMVDFHGCTIPRGWQRTYPNLVTMEAVRGSEQYWDKSFAENAPMFDTIYVFTRNAVGPMDYTPAIFTDVAATNAQIVPHLTTNAHELALLVVFESGVQHVADSAASLRAQPDFVQDYLHGLPTAWDETRVLAGAPGELAVLARRLGRNWYVSGINGEKSAKTITVPLAFLAAPADVSLIADGATPREFAHRAFAAGPAETLTVGLAARGGFAARFHVGEPGGGGAEKKTVAPGPDDKRAFPDAPAGFDVKRNDIPHGRLEVIEYESKTVGATRRMSVYTPPGYSSARKYPVLYLLHGIGGDEHEWPRFGIPDVILDNLIAGGRAVPMVVVMPNGRARRDDGAGGDIFSPENIAAFGHFEGDLLDDIIPTIQARYSVRTDHRHRALAGLSMGGGQSLNIGLRHLETFAWVGAFSAAPNAKNLSELIPSSAEANKRLQLLWLSCGSQDGLLGRAQDFHAWLKDNKIAHVWNVDDFAHDTPEWRNNLYHFSQLIFR